MRIRASEKEERREALVRTGARLFAEHGFAATTVEQIATAAEIGKATFYNYFPAKEDLALAVVATLQADKAELMFEVAEASSPTAERMAAILTGPLEWITANPDLTMVWCVERVRRERFGGPSVFNQALTRAVEVGQERGELRRDRHAMLMAAELEGLLLVHILFWYHSGQQVDIRALVADAARTYVQGAATQVQ